MPQLRPSQMDLMDRLHAEYAALYERGERLSVLCVAPTGFGKTVCFADLAANRRHAEIRVLVLAHRRELIRQASAKLRAAGVEHGCIGGGHPLETGLHVQVASVQTLARRLHEPWAQNFDAIIIDEAHHCVSPAYLRILDASPNATLAGFTASPERLDGRGLGVSAGGPFQSMVLGPTVRQLQTDGHLCRARVFAPAGGGPDLKGLRSLAGDYARGALASRMSRPQLVGDAVEHYTRHAPGRPALAFCTSVEHSRVVAAAFAAAGYRAVAVDGTTAEDVRDAAMAGLATGQVQVLCTCDLISEGLDVPSVECVILLRPTQSRILHVQQVGRGLRVDGDKVLIVLDHAGNCMKHGLPDHEHVWSLEGRPKRAKSAVAVRQCPKCYALHAPAPACLECGHVYEVDAPARGRGPRQVAGQLEEVTAAQAARERRVTLWKQVLLSSPSKEHVIRKAKSYQDLADIAKAAGHKPGWAWHEGKRLGLKLHRLPVNTEAA